MHQVIIKDIANVTHDVLCIITEKPAGLEFSPGQAADISINKPGWKEQKRAFTFTSLPTDSFLEFTIKTYPDHKGVTNELLLAKSGDSLIVHDVFGDISYKGEGLFIAGGAGVTPFIAIMKQLAAEGRIGNNKLLFANKTRADIIDQERFKQWLGDNFINVLSDEKAEGYEHGFINEVLLKAHLEDANPMIYLCGPPLMMEAVEKALTGLDVDATRLVKEAF